MKTPWISIGVSAVSLALIGVAYARLPAVIPIHWDLNGTINGTGPREMIFLLGGLPLGMTLFFMALPKIDPQRASWAKHEKAYRAVIFAMDLFMIAISWLVVAAAIGVPVKVENATMILMGAMFIVFGNFMPKFRHNYVLGIRTPWALADEETWKKTHRMGGYAFILMGLDFIVPGVIPGGGSIKWIIAFALFFAILAAIFVYSWAVFPKNKAAE